MGRRRRPTSRNPRRALKVKPLQLAVAAGAGALAYSQNWLGLKDKVGPLLPAGLGSKLKSAMPEAADYTSDGPSYQVNPQQVLREVAAAAKVNPTQVSIVSTRQAVSSDTSLGCPRPSEVYAQVNTAIIEVICQVVPFYTRWRWAVPARGGTARVCLIG